MPWFGAHMSAAGEPANALVEAGKFGMEACQLFTKSNRQWQANELPDAAIARFRSLRTELNIQAAVAHAAYLLNLATKDHLLRNRSIDALLVELQRAEALGIDYLVVHPGTASDDDDEAAVTLAAQACDTVLRRLGPARVQLLLETTAGQGRSIGHRFEQLAGIAGQMKSAERIGYCLDTCHVFAAGYPLTPRRWGLKTLAEFDRILGLERLKVFHLNDSAKPLGSRVDRHAHLGLGEIGLDGFALIVKDKRFRERPMILETPKGTVNGEEWDAVNLRVARGLLRNSAGKARA